MLLPCVRCMHAAAMCAVHYCTVLKWTVSRALTIMRWSVTMTHINWGLGLWATHPHWLGTISATADGPCMRHACHSLSPSASPPSKANDARSSVFANVLAWESTLSKRDGIFRSFITTEGNFFFATNTLMAIRSTDCWPNVLVTEGDVIYYTTFLMTINSSNQPAAINLDQQP